MSFAGTPLGQGRRRDHETFLNGGQPRNQQEQGAQSPPRKNTIALSYAYGAPSPPKNTLPQRNPSPTRSTTSRSARSGGQNEEDENEALSNASDTSPHNTESGAVRYARLKQRNQAQGPGTIISPPKPNGVHPKDTSVNIATAFRQAAASTLGLTAMPPTSISSSRTARGTTAEYERESYANTNTSTGGRSLPGPPSRTAARSAARRPNSKANPPIQPGEETEEDQTLDENGNDRGARAKSPFEMATEAFVRAVSPARIFLRQRSTEPEGNFQPMVPPGSPPQKPRSGSRLAPPDASASYDYSHEERLVNAMEESDSAKRSAAATRRKSRLSHDNKAYRPTASDNEEDSYSSDDGAGGRRRKKKKDLGAGLTLPTIEYGAKRRGTKRKSTAKKGDDAESGHEGAPVPELRVSAPRSIRGSVPPTVIPDSQPEMDWEPQADESYGVEQELIEEQPPELSEDQLEAQLSEERHAGLGAALGKVVHGVWQLAYRILVFIFRVFAVAFVLVTRIVGSIVQIVFTRPATWISKTTHQLRENVNWPLVGRWLIGLSVVYIAVYAATRSSDSSDRATTPSRGKGWLPGFGSRPDYKAPDYPPESLDELIRRLAEVEGALADIALANKEAVLKVERSSRQQGDVAARIGSLELRLDRETTRAIEAEEKYRAAAAKGIAGIRNDLESISASASSSDKKALTDLRSGLTSLEDRIVHAEAGIKEALDASKNAVKAPSTSGSVGWWNKISSGSDGTPSVVIKSSDGQDVTSLIGQLVDSAVLRHSKDTISRLDFALWSGGGRVIPSLTTHTFEIKPTTWGRSLWAKISGAGNPVGRPPVTALHPDIGVGNCWPFAGSTGQLGVLLSRPVFITHFTIDHAAKEVAFDVRAAPRRMEVWGLVDGRDNMEKIAAYNARKEQEGSNTSDESSPPPTFPSSGQYFRIASFMYDVHAPSHIQTFSVPEEIQELGVDFGIVVLHVQSNWGESDFTCLYRFRVHGTEKGRRPPLLPEEASDS